MISYAQNAEDVVLARLFAGRRTGRYVDVGAGDPVADSVTRHFYELGWRGVNVEPTPALADLLRQDRPDDVVVPVAVDERPGTAVLHVFEQDWGRATLDAALAGTYRKRHGWQVREIEVEVVTLAALLDAHPGPVDFLKIDVEGAELGVLSGADIDRHRPRVVVVEATEPGSPRPSHAAWEPILLAAGYRCALFDGLNRFYAQAEDTEALERLSAPANVLDGFEPYWKVRLLADVAAARAAEAGYLKRLEGVLRQAHSARERDAERIRELTAEVARLRDANAELERGAQRLNARLEDVASAHAVPRRTT